jgi:hypothetical protein
MFVICGIRLHRASKQSERVFMSNGTYTKRITYSKEFLSGNLEGLRVRCELKTTDDACAAHMNALNKITPMSPGSDVITGARFWVYNLGCEDIAATCNECGSTKRDTELSGIDDPICCETIIPKEEVA